MLQVSCAAENGRVVLAKLAAVSKLGEFMGAKGSLRKDCFLERKIGVKVLG